MDSHALSREEFDSRVYYPLEDAVHELKKRRGHPGLEAYVRKILPSGIPEIMRGKQSIVLFRHLATPNYEVHRFAQVADVFPELQPVLFEYLDDKFVRVNEGKRFLAEPRFYQGTARGSERVFEKKAIVGFNESNGKQISSLRTHWGEKLVDAHHRLFNHQFPHLQGAVVDLSSWLRNVGPTAKDYYKSFFSLFLKDGILFENYLPAGSELAFTRDIILPALVEIERESGCRPLIVALEPTDIEGDVFWLAHPPHLKDILVV